MSFSIVASTAARTAVIGSAKPGNCALCASRQLCWSSETQCDDSWQAKLEFSKRKVKRGAALFRMGDSFDNLYAIRSGAFKSSVLLEDGREQVTGFKMVGELLGLDGIDTDEHMSDAVALEDSEVCVIPYARVIGLGREAPALANEINRTLSREIVHDQSVMALLGTMQAEERVIVFLLSLAQRYEARGYATNEFVLRMTREEIGSYLGLKLETVSRAFSRLQSLGLLALEHNRSVRLLKPAELRARIHPSTAFKVRIRRPAPVPHPSFPAVAAA
jgi:CRP/FNR family transcriptional regulator